MDIPSGLSFGDRYRDTWASPTLIHQQAQDLRVQLENTYATKLTREERDEIAQQRLGTIPESADELVQLLQNIEGGTLSERAKEYRRAQEIGRFWLENSGEITGNTGSEYTTIFGTHLQHQTVDRAAQIAELRPELVGAEHDIYEAALENPGGNRGAFGFKSRGPQPETHPTATAEQVKAMQ